MLTEEDIVVQRVDGTAIIGGESVDWRTVGIYRLQASRVAEVWLVPLDLQEFEQAWVDQWI